MKNLIALKEKMHKKIDEMSEEQLFNLFATATDCQIFNTQDLYNCDLCKSHFGPCRAEENSEACLQNFCQYCSMEVK